ncbi:MAG: leucine-rich repeat domain-containing protein, partial [Clostridia bacterium]|nr:leucine-rich repeat domain-containing protein [Clostridia bacterium]
MKEKDLLKKIKKESDSRIPDVYDKVVNAANAQGLLNDNGDTQVYSDGKTVVLGGFKRKAVIPIALALVVAVGLSIALPLALRGNSNEGEPPVIDDDHNKPGPPSPPKPDDDKYAVVYKGMSASANAQAETNQSNAKLMSAKVSEKASVQAEYNAYRNEDFYINVKFENPKNYAILGLTITYSGTTNLFPCSSFEDSGDSENVFVRVKAKKSAATDVTAEYTISNITYNDGKEIKSAVYAEGANTSITVAINEYGTEVDKTQAVTGTKLNCLDSGMLSEGGVLTIPQGITEIGRYAFAYDESIKEIIIPDTVQTIDEGAFYDCLSVEKVTIGSGVKFIDKNAFHKCENISYVNYTGTLTDWCKIDFAYTESQQTERMQTVSIDKDIRYSNPTFFAHDLHINGELITEVIVPQEITAVKYATFARCTSITKVVLHENVKSIGYYAFVTCTGINEIDLGGVQIIDASSFDGCYGITRLTLPETLQEIKSGAFRAAEKIIEVYNLSKLNLDIGRATNGYVAKYATHVYAEVPAESNFLTDEDGFVWYTNPEIESVIFLVGYVGTKTEITVPLTYE